MPNYYFEMNQNLKEKENFRDRLTGYQANLMIFHHNHCKRNQVTENVNYNPEKGNKCFIEFFV